MKLGTEDKKKTFLAAGLTAVALGTVYFQLFSEDPQAGRRASSAARATAPQSAIPAQPRPARGVAAVANTTTTARRRTTARRAAGGAFEPIWRRSHEDETFDALAEDPSLATERLAAVRGVTFDGVERNIFRFGERKRVVEAPTAATANEAQRRQDEFAARAQQAAAAQPKAEPARAGAPRLTWKYFGYASPAGDDRRRAFLLDGDEVLIGSAGDVLMGRYKLVRIGLAAVVIEDMQFNEEQSLAITAPK